MLLTKSGFYGCAEFSLSVSCKLFIGNILLIGELRRLDFFAPTIFLPFSRGFELKLNSPFLFAHSCLSTSETFV